MGSILFIICMYIYCVFASTLEVLNYDDNEGYIPIKIGEVFLTDHYVKILHAINVTELQQAKTQIERNIESLTKSFPRDIVNDNIDKSIMTNFKQLEIKFRALQPHVHKRQRRGLVNVIGKTLKIIAGTMDSDDELEIKNALENLKEDNSKLIQENNKQVVINRKLGEQIAALNKDIHDRQLYIAKYINDVLINTQIRNNFIYLEIVFQINNDINVFLHFIDTIEDVILTSRLGILTRNILTESETDLIENIKEFEQIKVATLTIDDEIIISLLIPKFSNETFERIKLEQTPDKVNETVIFSVPYILLDNKKTPYHDNVKDNKIKNLIPIKDACIESIFKKDNANCAKTKLDTPLITEIEEGLIITKNSKPITLSQNCIPNNITIKGTKLIKFFNCSISFENIFFQNIVFNVESYYVNPGFLKIVNRSQFIEKPSLESIKLNSIENRNFIENTNHKIRNYNNIQNIGISLIVCLCIFVFVKHTNKVLCKHCKKLSGTKASTNDGGVIEPPPDSTSPTPNHESVF